ncbi:MAG: translocation/assembly module TamB domain-containing protein [Synechococcales bacterium]|nr:translocation/assembly module TamB domain-containing protein [Synechococcales bacterium]
MTHSPNPEKEPDPSFNRRPTRWQWASALLGMAVVTGSFAAGIGIRNFIYKELVPLVETNLEATLARPVDLGEVEGFSPIGIRFGPSVVPPTPTDADQAAIAAIRVRFNPLSMILNQQLGLHVTLVRPTALLDQEADGRWLATEIQDIEPGLIEVTVKTVRLEEGTVALLPHGDGDSANRPFQAALLAQAQANPADLAALLQTWLEEADGDRPWVVVRRLDGLTRLGADYQQADLDLEGRLASGGEFAVEGEINLEDDREANLMVRAQRLVLPGVLPLLPDLPIDLEAGVLNSQIRVQLRSDPAEQPLSLEGTARLARLVAQVPGVPGQLTDGFSQLRFNGQQATLEDTTVRYGKTTIRANGRLHLQDGYNITAQAETVAIDELLENLEVAVPVALRGRFQAAFQLRGPIDQPSLSGTINNVGRVRVDQVTLDLVRARMTATAQALSINALEAVPTVGGLVVGNGRVDFPAQNRLELNLQASEIPGDRIVRLYAPQLYETFPNAPTLGDITARARITGTLNRLQTAIQWNAPGGPFPAQGDVVVAGDTVFMRATSVQIANGQVRAEGRLDLSDQKWQAIANFEQVPLNQFAADLTGDLDGMVNLSGTLAARTLADIEADGQIRLSDAPVLDTPLAASFAWSGNQLTLREATAPGLQASGVITAQFQENGTPVLDLFDLNVQVADYKIDALPIGIAKSVQLAGRANFDGRVAGSLSIPTVTAIDGEVGLEELVINGIAFDPLYGPVQFAASQGATVDLEGRSDRIALTLDENLRPVDFTVRRGDTQATGQTEGDRLLTRLENFPVEALNIKPITALRLGALGGVLSGNLAIDLASLDWTNPANLNALSATGDLEVERPRLGYIGGQPTDRFLGQVQLANGIATLNGGVLQLGGSRYDLMGRITVEDGVAFRGRVTTQAGRVTDLLAALQIFDLSDFGRGFAPPVYGNADDLETIVVGDRTAPLYQQLQRYAEILALRDIQKAEAEEAIALPPLRDLEGTFSGTVDVAISPQEGLAAEFDLAGQDWRWGEYAQPNQLIATGTLTNNTLTLLPLRFESGETVVNYAGQLSTEDDATGQLRAENISVALLRDFFKIPIEMTGNLNATAALTGSTANLQARGEINLADGVLNGSPVQQADARFSYADARLNLIGGMTLADTDPISIRGSLPYQLPNATVAPASNEISLDLQVQNDGLALLNLINNQIAWEDGVGAVSLRVGGTLDQTPNGLDLNPQATGLAEFTDATFTAQTLPEPLTNVTGRIRFEEDLIYVDSIQGAFSDGNFSAVGVLPLADPFTPLAVAEGDRRQPLGIQLTGLAVNFKGLYDGDVDGQLVVGGTALAPELSGEVVLSNGRVSLPDPTVASALPPPPPEDPFASIIAPIELTDLQVTLGDRLLITRAPILNFVADGTLLVNGPLTGNFLNLRPDGTIRLRSGQVNLFTTRFSLDGGFDNRAIFQPASGVDPIVSLRLRTSVLEQTRRPLPAPSLFPSAEIADVSANDFAELQSVRIEATVEGPASQLFENIELSSSPARSDVEIVTLLGGGFAETPGQGSGTLEIANLAGSALLTGLRTLIGNRLSEVDFRLFPTVITSDERDRSDERSASTLGLAAELGVDITRNLSVSALQLLTAREPTQFSLRYRINDQLRLRGSTNFSDDSRLVLEYEARF